MEQQLKGESIAGKTILEIGCGNGDSTREIARLLAGSDAELIVTDINDKFFSDISGRLDRQGVAHRCIRTGACELEGIPPQSVDFIVCNFTLCVVNTQIGHGTIALNKFHATLKPGGKLYIREEVPITQAEGPMQKNWALMWRLMKSALMLARQRIASTEYQPEVMAQLCEIVGFTDVEWVSMTQRNTIDWYVPRMEFIEHLEGDFPHPDVFKMYRHLAQRLRKRGEKTGSVEVPSYSMVATKPDA